MDVIVRTVTIEENGERTEAEAFASMVSSDGMYELAYSEDLSGEGIKTSTIMRITDKYMSIVREGEVSSEFIYEENTVHNSLYETFYGDLPISIETSSYGMLDFIKKEQEVVFRMGDEPKQSTCLIRVDASFKVDFGGEVSEKTIEIEIHRV